MRRSCPAWPPGAALPNTGSGRLDRHYPNVIVGKQSEITPDDALGHGFTDILVATGSRWRSDGVGRWHTSAIPIADDAGVLTPDDLLTGGHPLCRPGTVTQRILVFDDDHYYLGGVLAEMLARLGHEVRLVTPAPLVSSWTAHTLEVGDIQRRVREAGIIVETSRVLVAITAGEARTACAFTGSQASVPADAVLLVTARIPCDDLYLALEQRQGEWPARGVRSVNCVGDAWAPDHDRRRGMGGSALRGGIGHARTAITRQALPARVHGPGQLA